MGRQFIGEDWPKLELVRRLRARVFLVWSALMSLLPPTFVSDTGNFVTVWRERSDAGLWSLVGWQGIFLVFCECSALRQPMGSVPWIGISRYCVRSASAHGSSGPPDGYVGVLGLLGA